MSGIPLGFSLTPLSVPLAHILPSRKMSTALIQSRKFKQIRASIEAIGLIEPLSVTPKMSDTGQHMLLDGHLRLIVLAELDYREAPCLLSNDDESYTYNSRISRLSTIQEHLMIRLAIERGVAPDRLAKALSVDVSLILKKMALLDGICQEAAALLEHKQFTPDISRVLRKMKPVRQIECVELMISANMLTLPYASSMLLATPSDLLIGKKPKKLDGVTSEQMAKMEREMAKLQGQYRLVEKTYGQDVLNFVLARGYLVRLLENVAAARYLHEWQPDIAREFESIARIANLESLSGQIDAQPAAPILISGD